jgi:precorrin isomerase
MKSATILTIGVIVCVATAAGGQEAAIRPQVPVIIEHSLEGYAPCAYGVVHNLDPKGDGFLAVKAGPGLHYERIDKLSNGKEVIICDQKGVWHAIVYTKNRQEDAMRYCNVEENRRKKDLPYTGPCRSGWAHQRWIKQISR